MQPLLAIVAGGLFAAGIYMMLRRSIIKLVIGLGIISHAINLVILSMGHLEPGAPPLIGPDAMAPVGPYSDPLPQALILTAIVISFGVQAFALVLIKRSYQETGTDDLNQLKSTEEL